MVKCGHLHVAGMLTVLYNFPDTFGNKSSLRELFMKKVLQKLGIGILYIIIYIGLSCFLMLIIATLFGTKDADGITHVSGFVLLTAVIAPVLGIWAFSRIKKARSRLNKDIENNANEGQHHVIKDAGKMPSVRKCRELADALITDAKRTITFAHEESSITAYFSLSDCIKEKLSQATRFEEKAGYRDSEKPSLLLKRFEDEFQWKLRDVIEREEDGLIKEINGPQRNNKRSCCQGFIDEINMYKDYFSEETVEFAMKAYYHVCSVAGLSVQNGVCNDSTPMESVDKMDGHEFEYFCADLLSKNGFSNVEVTKGSGDQGVDILAEKDGIRYAIQCKCYSSDLGNKPVQEAFAGKSIYHCQIAAVLTNRYFTQGGIEAARATGVLLWDRKKLQSFIDNAE